LRRKFIDRLQDGRLRVVSEPTPFNGGYIGINSFGFGGSNTHVCLRSHPKPPIDRSLPANAKLPKVRCSPHLYL